MAVCLLEVHIGLNVSKRIGTMSHLRALENLENRDSDCPSGDTEAAMSPESPSKADFPLLSHCGRAIFEVILRSL